MNNADVLNFYIYLPRISIKTNALKFNVNQDAHNVNEQYDQ